MTKSSNVKVIVDRMIDYMISINDNHYKTEIASRCVELAEQFAPSNHWFIQTMNKVFEHSGDLVNPKVGHNLMRLIAEGFGEDDDGADIQLRSSAVESYLRLMGEPKLPSAFLQVICWVLGEYGTADGKYSASYISGRLCDVAEAHSSDDAVKAYAVTALMKVYSFEIAAGRKLDMLPECQSLVEDLSASHSTDLQQRAYELQALIGVDPVGIENIMPLDASCEDIEIDKSLSFLKPYVQKSLEMGAQPYINESERSGTLDTRNLRYHDQIEASSHSLRFEAYDLPKPPIPERIPQTIVHSTELVPVPEPSYQREIHNSPSLGSIPDAGSSELKLRLDGVQKKWARPTYSSSIPSSSHSDSHKVINGPSISEAANTAKLKSHQPSSSDSRWPHVEISPEKKKLAASLFGDTSGSEKKHSVSSHKASKTSNHVTDKSHVQVTPSELASAKITVQPSPDLLDLGESTGTSRTLSVDPFKQLEGLLHVPENYSGISSASNDAVKGRDIMSLYVDMSGSSGASLVSSEKDDPKVMLGVPWSNSRTVPYSKGPNLKDSLEKDALVRQTGVTPTSQNPDLLSDLLG